MTTPKISKKQNDRINDAIKNLIEINKLIAPYPVSSRIEEMRSDGQWEKNIKKEIVSHPRNKPLSLYPLTEEEILDCMLQTPPMPKENKRSLKSGK